MSTEINGYIEERNNQFDTEHAETVKWKLDAMGRDFAIYLSRINYLDDMLYKCDCLISKLGHAIRHGKDDAVRTLKLKECVDYYLRWHSLRREFHAALRKSETQWEKDQDSLLQLLA